MIYIEFKDLKIHFDYGMYLKKESFYEVSAHYLLLMELVSLLHLGKICFTQESIFLSNLFCRGVWLEFKVIPLIKWGQWRESVLNNRFSNTWRPCDKLYFLSLMHDRPLPSVYFFLRGWGGGFKLCLLNLNIEPCKFSSCLPAPFNWVVCFL